MKLQLVKATTSQNLLVFIQDSSSTTGAGLTGLVFDSAGLTGFYYRENQGAGATSITLATATIGTWATGGFVEIDAADMPGWYELGIPDAALATGADFVGVQLKGATNMAQLNLEIQLTDLDMNTVMRGTDSAALASVCTEARLAELAAANLPSDIVAILADVTGIGGAAMRGTDSGALASVCTEGRLAELDAANLPTDVAARATPAQVNTEVADVFNVDTITEPSQAIPPASGVATKQDALRYLYFALTNRVDSDAVANFLEFLDRAGVTVQWKKPMSDAASIATEGTGESGP